MISDDVERIGEAITLVEHHAAACPSGRITAHDFLVHICKGAGESAQKERIIGIGQQRADIKLSAAAMDDPIPTAKEQ